MQIQPGVFSIHNEDYPRALEVWDASVRATHHFVCEADIQFFRPLVQNGFLQITEKACVRNELGQLAGFVGVVDRKVEMLFIHPEVHGHGAGKRLLNYAIRHYSAVTLDVNEQNEQAVGFYLHMGFEVVGRSKLDGTGKPYPLLHMRLASLAQDEPEKEPLATADHPVASDRLVVINEPDPQDVQFLEDRLYEYNVESTGITDGNLMAIFVRDDHNEIIAGLYGWTWGRTCEIRSLWVHKQLRGRGLGARLLTAAVAEARARGAAQIFLSTHSFQAPDFYRRFGFEPIGQIEDYPTGHQEIFMRKQL